MFCPEGIPSVSSVFVQRDLSPRTGKKHLRNWPVRLLYYFYMALTNEDIQLIKEALRSEFEQINKRFERVDHRFEAMDKRFDQVDQRFDRVEQRLEGIEKSLNELTDAVTVDGNERYSDHEERIKTLEAKVHTPS